MPSNPRLKNIPQSATTGIFRLIDRRLRSDPIVRAAVKTFRSWEGDAKDFVAPSIAECPWVCLTPRADVVDFWAASSLKGWMYVDVEIWIPGTCYDDIMNLWWAMMRAIYTADAQARNTFQASLRDAGAYSGLIRFTQPTTHNATDDHFEARASMALEYRFDQNPTSSGL